MKVKNHIENEYAAGCARVSCGCVAYHGALQYYALQTQQFNTIYLHSDKRFRPFVIDGVAYEYHPLKFTYNVVISKDPEGNQIAYMMAMHAPEDDQMLVDPDAADTDILQDENDNADEDVREDLDDLQGPDAEDLEEMEEEMAEDAIETVEMEAESDADEELVITEE